MRTAPSLNSGSYFLRVSGMTTPGASVEGTEILTGVLEATVRDPSRSRPRHQAHRRAHIPRGSRRRRATRPYFHACEASPEGQGAHSACLHGFRGCPSQRLDGEGVMALSDRLVGGLGLPRYSASQRELFFRLLDRGGTIRAAAVGAGVAPDTGCRWRRQAGVAARRQRPRTYTAEEKAEFFRLLHIRGNVSAVARELGYVRVTCYKWAH